MFNLAKHLLLAAAILAPAAVTASAHAQYVDTFRVSNESNWRIDRVFIAASSSNNWGSDRLSGYLQPNFHLDTNVYAGRYDVMIVDKDGSKCVVKNIDVYNDKVFHVTNQVLLACEYLSN